jgi:hypothetical protein
LYTDPRTIEYVRIRESWDIDGQGDDLVRADYVDFVRVLRRAYDQTAVGKGSERHGGRVAFDRQPVMTEIEQSGTTAGAVFQVRKKMLESLRLPPERARHEILGAIVYAAAAYLGTELLEAKE